MSRNTREYAAVSNFFKNTQKLTRDELKVLVKEVIEEKLEDLLQREFARRDVRLRTAEIEERAARALVQRAVKEVMDTTEFVVSTQPRESGRKAENG